MENSKKHILIVDDDDRIRNLLKDFLSENNYIVSSAEHADEAKEKLQYLKFDIIILDVMMPGQNGYELTKEIKKEFQIPIILLTAKGEVENRISLTVRILNTIDFNMWVALASNTDTFNPHQESLIF